MECFFIAKHTLTLVFHHQLQSVVIEQSDELDRCNSQLDLIKQLKQHCLSGDTQKVARVCGQLNEQCEQLVEVCKMLNQVAPTNKIKITTKTLAIWFDLNIKQLVGVAQCLANNPRARVAKDCTWAYLQGKCMCVSVCVYINSRKKEFFTCEKNCIKKIFFLEFFRKYFSAIFFTRQIFTHFFHENKINKKLTLTFFTLTRSSFSLVQLLRRLLSACATACLPGAR